MAVLLKDVMPGIINAQNDWRILLLKNWPSIVGSLCTRVCLQKVTLDMVIVGVYESHWMQELYLLSPLLIDSINTFLGKPYIKQIRFKLVEERPVNSSLKKYEKRSFLKSEAVLNNDQKRALEKIADPQLKDALIRFWGKCQTVSLSNSK